MQEQSDGSRGFGNGGQQGSGLQRDQDDQMPGLNLVNQTQSQPRQTQLTTPTEEGALNVFGQARFTQEPVDSDCASLPHRVNDEAHSRQASPSLGAWTPIVPSSRTGQALRHLNDRPPTGRREVQQQFGVDVRSESYTNSNEASPCYWYNQSASGFSNVRMNEASGGQLRSFPATPTLNHSQRQQNDTAATLRGRACVVPDEHVQPVLPAVKDFLQNQLGVTYTNNREKCYKSFREAEESHETASAYADQLLSFLAGDVIKCLLCNSRHDKGLQFSHSNGCLVEQAYQHLQNSSNSESETELSSSGRESNLQMPGVTRKGEKLAVPQTPSPPPEASEIAVPSAARGRIQHSAGGGRNESSAGVRNENVARERKESIVYPPVTSQPSTPVASGTAFHTADMTQGATGGYETTHLKTVDRSGTNDIFAQLTNMGYTQGSIEKILKRFGRRTLSSVDEFLALEESYTNNRVVSNTAGSATLNDSQPYHTAPTKNMNTYPARGSPGVRSSALQQPVASSSQSLGPGYMQFPSTASTASLESNRPNRMDASYCSACKQRRATISQLECGHIVCKECAPSANDQSGLWRCKRCNEVVVEVNGIDPSCFQNK